MQKKRKNANIEDNMQKSIQNFKQNCFDFFGKR